jgi:glutaredoxin
VKEGTEMKRTIGIVLLTSALIAPAQAGGIEDAFKAFIDRVRSQGREILEHRLGQGFAEVRTPVLDRRVDDLPLARDTFAVFVTPGCRGCADAEAYLRKRGYNFEVLDVSRSKTAREAYSLVKGNGFPTVLIGNQRLTGWNERLFRRAHANSIQEQSAGQQGTGA